MDTNTTLNLDLWTLIQQGAHLHLSRCCSAR